MLNSLVALLALHSTQSGNLFVLVLFYAIKVFFEVKSQVA